MKGFEIEKVHISRVRSGDCIFHDGKEKTVSDNDIKRCDFMGITIFGDSYKLGYQLVRRFKYINPLTVNSTQI